MAILRSDIIVLYRTGNSDSLSFAQFYRDAHGLLNDNLLAVPCSGNEVLASYSAFQSEVENTVSDYINAHANVKVIVVGYGVPGGFHSGPYVISTTSRLSVIVEPFSANTTNGLYDRKISKRISTAEFSLYKIVGRIDAPTLAEAQSYVSRAISLMRQGEANGLFYFDPYPVDTGADAEAYAADLSSFQTNALPILNLDTFTTTSDHGQDVVIPHAVDDSFIWACGAPTTTDSFFQSTASFRIFLYNADTDNAYTIRDARGSRWPRLSLKNGYTSTAGSMSFASGGSGHYMRPQPFFESLLQGASLAEAYLFSVKYLNSPETFLGDPLTHVKFPAGQAQESSLLPVDIGVELMIARASSAAGVMYQRSLFAHDFLTYAGNWDLGGSSANTLWQNNMLAVFNNLYNKHVATFSLLNATLFAPIVPPSQQLSSSLANAYLSGHNIKVGTLFTTPLLSSSVVIDSGNVLENGTWRFDFLMSDPVAIGLTTYTFVLEVHDRPNFGHVILSIDTSLSSAGWSFQYQADSYADLPQSGIPSSYSGRVIRYMSGSPLNTQMTYYVKVMQVANGTPHLIGQTSFSVSSYTVTFPPISPVGQASSITSDMYVTGTTKLGNLHALADLIASSLTDLSNTLANTSASPINGFARSSITNALQITNNRITAFDTTPPYELQVLVQQLQSWISSQYDSVDGALAYWGITVTADFAELSRACGYPILDTNISG